MVVYFVIFVALVVAAAVRCAVVAVRAEEPPRSRTYVVRASILGAFAGLAPIAVVLFLRLSIKVCIGANVLGLPWAEPWRELAHWGGGAVWLASTIMIAVALLVPRYRQAGLAMVKWSAAIAAPTLFLYFMTMYGDPGEGCVPA